MEESTGLVHGDIRLLERAIQNIIDNAFKFTPPGGRVTVSLARAGSKVRFAVSDTGPGIAPEDLPHIFERFYRSESSGAGSGVGLGLAISQRIADLHGTVIEAQNLPEGGSRFTMDLDPWSHADTL